MSHDAAVSGDGQAALDFIQRDGYMLLAGKYWHALYKLLPPAPDGSTAPAPLILGGSAMTTDREKFDRLVEHIVWADEHGGIDCVKDYLMNLDPKHCERVEAL